MLTALLNGKKVIASDTNLRNENYKCQYCKDQLVLVKCAYKIDHFRHKPGVVCCNHEPETLQHMIGKQFLYDFFEDYDPELEKMLPNGRIADVYLNKVDIAIEFQCSPIEYKNIEERTRDYKKLGVHVLWVFGEGYFFNRYYKKKTFETNFSKLKIGEKYIYDQNYISIKAINNSKAKKFKSLNAESFLLYLISDNTNIKFIEVLFFDFKRNHKFVKMTNLSNDLVTFKFKKKKGLCCPIIEHNNICDFETYFSYENKFIQNGLNVLSWDRYHNNLMNKSNLSSKVDKKNDNIIRVSLDIPNCFLYFDSCYINHLKWMKAEKIWENIERIIIEE